MHALARKALRASALALALFASSAQAGVIVDLAVEAANSRTGLNGWVSAGGWYSLPGTASGFFSQRDTEGGWITHSNAHEVSNADVSLGTHTLQAGTYRISFAMGNYSNVGFSMGNSNPVFAGLSAADATEVSRTNPARGRFELWQFAWDVAEDSAQIGNALSFSIRGGASVVNAAIDGVGALSDLGSGFIVEYVAAVPGPSAAVLLVGAFAAAYRRRTRKARS